MLDHTQEWAKLSLTAQAFSRSPDCVVNDNKLVTCFRSRGKQSHMLQKERDNDGSVVSKLQGKESHQTCDIGIQEPRLLSQSTVREMHTKKRGNCKGLEMTQQFWHNVQTFSNMEEQLCPRAIIAVLVRNEQCRNHADADERPQQVTYTQDN